MPTKGGKATENGGDWKQTQEEKQKKGNYKEKSLNTAKKWAGGYVNGATVPRHLCEEIEPRPPPY